MKFTVFLLLMILADAAICVAQVDSRNNSVPMWHTDGRIFFMSGRDGGGGSVYTVKRDGSDARRFISSPAGDNYPPRWTADGKRGVFMTNRDGDFEIYGVKADGSGLTRLTFNKGHDWDPGWSPDGKSIVFMASKDGNWEIYRMDADGGNQTRLTNNTGRDFSPAFSPDGKKILFASDRDGNEDIFTMNADGTGAVNLAPAAGFDGTPEWSHDGKWIVFHSRRDGGEAEIYVMKPDGSALRRLTDNKFSDVYPYFSKNGKKIVFQSNRDGFKDLYVMNTDGSGQVRLFAAVNNFSMPANGSAEGQIRAVFDITATGWNTGDLSKYLFAYVPEATEMLSTGPAGGVEAIEKTMREGFWKTGRPLQMLRYENLVVRMLGNDNALVTGQYILSGADKPDRKGWFTSVWTRTNAGWRMIHDHS